MTRVWKLRATISDHPAEGLKGARGNPDAPYRTATISDHPAEGLKACQIERLAFRALPQSATTLLRD